MLKLVLKLLHTLFARGTLVVCVLVVGGFGTHSYLKDTGHLSPGKLSARQSPGDMSGGYVSHAEFENECSHCHAPLHCVTDTRCQECHIEIARQRASATGLHSKLPGTMRCQNCHQEHQGPEADIARLAFNNVNHEKLAGFSLDRHTKDYANNPLGCESCHMQDSYAGESLDCLTCHIEADHETISLHAEEYGSQCTVCHDGKDRMLDFDHNSIYVLDHKHAETECESCHGNKIFDNAPRQCVGCHAEPELHASLFGTDCERCHSTLAWAPAQLIQHTFVLSHGEESILACENCHAGTYTAYPCYSCHDEGEMRGYHAELEIEAYQNCLECHPTGRSSEAVASAPQQPGNPPAGSGVQAAQAQGEYHPSSPGSRLAKFAPKSGLRISLPRTMPAAGGNSPGNPFNAGNNDPAFLPPFGPPDGAGKP